MADRPAFGLSAPIMASGNDAVVGMTEWGDPIYATSLGEQYHAPIVEEQPRGSMLGALASALSSDPIGAIASGAKSLFSSVGDVVSAPYRAFQGETMTVGDALDVAGMAQLGAVGGTAPAGALRSGMSRDAADQIDLSSIYDLPMDTASRMARAQEMGFDTARPMYHGTKSDFSGFNSMPWATDDASFAWDYAGLGDGANIAPVVMRADNTLNADMLPQRITVPEFYNAALDVAGGVDDEMIDRLSSSLDRAPSGEFMRHEMWNPPESRLPRDVIDRSMSDIRDLGLDSISMTEGGAPTLGVLDPTAVRSNFARFDPRLSHLRNLSAGGAAVAVPFGLLGGSEDDPI